MRYVMHRSRSTEVETMSTGGRERVRDRETEGKRSTGGQRAERKKWYERRRGGEYNQWGRVRWGRPRGDVPFQSAEIQSPNLAAPEIWRTLKTLGKRGSRGTENEWGTARLPLTSLTEGTTEGS